MTGINEFEAKRRQYMNWEVLVRSTGSFVLVGSGIGMVNILLHGQPAPLIFGPLMGLLMGRDESLRMPVYNTLIAAFFLLFAWQAMTGIGLRMLWPVSRLFAVVIATMGLIDTNLMGFHLWGYQMLVGFPQSTVLMIAIIWLMLSAQGRYVFSPEYRHIVQQTPHLNSKLSLLIGWLIVLWIVVGFLLSFGIPFLRMHLR